MSIKERFENHPIGYLIFIAVTSVSLTFGVMSFFHSQNQKILEHNYQIEIDKCNSIISSINRGIKEGNDTYFNVKNVFIKSSERLNNSLDFNYYSKEEFYTLSDSSYWTHETFKESELAVAQSLTQNKDLTNVTKALEKHDNKIHMWMGIETYTIENSSIFENISVTEFGSIITFQKIHIDSVSTIVTDVIDYKDLEEYKKWYRKHGLVNLIMSLMEQSKTTSKLHKEAVFEIQDIQKQDNFIYLRSITTINNLIVNTRWSNKFYIQTEAIGLLSNNYIYLINIIDPKMDKLSNNPEITKWLHNLRIVFD